MNEIWKPIKGYENRYLISDKGEVKSIKHNKILKKNFVGTTGVFSYLMVLSINIFLYIA